MITRITLAHDLALRNPLPDRHLARLYRQDPFPYLRFLYYVCKLHEIEIAVELGTCTGRGTAHLAASCNWVYTIDPEVHGAFAENTHPYHNITYYQTRSDNLDTLSKFKEKSVGLCFADSVHAADYCLKEISLWTPKMKEGGIFLLDDLDLMPDVLPDLPFADKGYLDKLHIKGFGYAVV